MPAKIAKLETGSDKRLICVSDIHGELDLFKALLEKVGFCDDDILVLLGDVYLKGSQCHVCLKYIMELSKRPNVHVLRGNCDWTAEIYLDADDKAWLDNLPHIIESDKFIFVHAGILSMNLQEQDPLFCMRNDAFMKNYNGKAFDKWVMAGHWPNVNYCDAVPCHNPIINYEKRIIAIDGGNVVNEDGQLNAFVVKGAEFSWIYADKFREMTVKQAQIGNLGSLNIIWLNRFVEIVEECEEFSHIRHLSSGKTLLVPTGKIWRDNEGRTCAGTMATDHWLAVNEGDVVSVVEVFSDRIFVKKDGISGWIWSE